MKTAEDKAVKWLLEYAPDATDVELRSLVLLLKEQDRDTRHACAEACLIATGNENLEIISKSYHDICMNVKAV